MAVLCLLLSLSVTHALLLDVDQVKLPQYHTYGKRLVLAGGHLDENNNEIYNTIVKLAGGENYAKIGIVTAGSADPADSCNYYSDLFLHRYKAQSVYCIPIDVNHTSNNFNDDVVDKIKQQTGFFFGGGDQQRIIDSLPLFQYYVLLAHISVPAMREITGLFDAGAVIAGSSAGTACQSSAVMIRGGMSWDALRYGAFKSENKNHPDDLIYNNNGGLRMLHGFILDTHFSQRGREGRLIRLLSDTRHLYNGVDWGIGVDENTALVIRHAGTSQAEGEIIGEHGVFFADVSNSHVDNSTKYFNIDNVMVHYLTHGDKIFLQNKTIKFSPTKTQMKGHENYDHALTTQDIFGGNRRHPTQKSEFTRVATSIFDSRLETSSYGDTYENNPRFRVTMSRAVAGAEGFVERKHSFHTDITSYRNLYVKIDLSP